MRRFALLFLLLCTVFCAPTQGKDTDKVYREVLSNSVVIYHDAEGYCTAVMIAPKTFLTAAHCLDHPTAELIDEFHRAYPVDRLVVNTDLDLATLHALVATKKPIEFAKKVEVDEPILSIGYSAVFDEDSIVSSFEQGHVISLFEGTFIVLDHSLRPGYSGGPMVNLKGQLVGINSMSHPGRNLGIAVSLGVINYFLKEAK